MTTNYYLGEYRSAIARAKRALVAAGLPWSKTTGRYSPYFSQQRTTFGLRVTRIGCSDTIALNAYGDRRISMLAAQQELQAKGLEVLRAAGLPFDDRGWLVCGAEARKMLAGGVR